MKYDQSLRIRTLPDPSILPPTEPINIALIGDIHGCLHEFQTLVAKIIHDVGCQEDEIVWMSLGDICDRGPDVHGCFEFLRSIGGVMVCGNHDDKMLRWKAGNKVKIRPSQEVSIASMKQEDFETIAQAPSFFRIPFYNAIAVHGGFLPAFAPGEQEHKQVIRIRHVSADGRKMISMDKESGETPFWAEKWEGPEHVYFGHAWNETAQLFPNATGLDTGCVYGNTLSAVLLTPGMAPYIYQVPAREAYWPQETTDKDK